MLPPTASHCPNTCPLLPISPALLFPSVICSTTRLRLAVSSSLASTLKLKVSLYTGLMEPSTAEVLLHLTNLLWFIRDTLTNTPVGQCTYTSGQEKWARAQLLKWDLWLDPHHFLIPAAQPADVTGTISVTLYHPGKPGFLFLPLALEAQLAQFTGTWHHSPASLLGRQCLVGTWAFSNLCLSGS